MLNVLAFIAPVPLEVFLECSVRFAQREEFAMHMSGADLNEDQRGTPADDKVVLRFTVFRGLG